MVELPQKYRQVCSWLRQWSNIDMPMVPIVTLEKSLGYIAARIIEDLYIKLEQAQRDCTSAGLATEIYRTNYNSKCMEVNNLQKELEQLRIENSRVWQQGYDQHAAMAEMVKNIEPKVTR